MRSFPSILHLTLLSSVALFASYCSKKSPSSKTLAETSELAFPRDRVIDIQLTLPQVDWDLLRTEGNDLSNQTCGSKERVEYTNFNAQLTIDGVSYGTAKIKKKGFLGSQMQSKPSLKVRLDTKQVPAGFNGLTRLVLNNNHQDTAIVKQCLAYDVFRAAGIATPACSFAKVSVNGQVIGTYTHVEDFSKSFLEREFGGKDDVLLEGTLSDFTPNLTSTFEIKEGDSVLATQKIQAVTEILNGNPENLIEQLNQHIDLDQFFRFWATEVLIAHWDGYANNRNNFFIRINPKDGRMSFIPWGVDGVFSAEDSFFKGKAPRPAAISAASKLTFALLNDPEGKRRYEATLRSLLDQVWKVESLQQNLASLRALVGSEVLESSYQSIEQYIAERGSQIKAELDGGPITWPLPYAEKKGCLNLLGSFEASFNTKWLGLVNPRTGGGGSGTINFVLNGQNIKMDSAYAVAGNAASPIRTSPTIFLVGQAADGMYISQIHIEEGIFKAPAQLKFQGFSTFGILLKLKSDGAVERLGLISAGNVSLDAAGSNLGDPVQGSLQGLLFSFP
jgi:spore coat protein CotH